MKKQERAGRPNKFKEKAKQLRLHVPESKYDYLMDLLKGLLKQYEK
jgi:hypothetical protein